MITAQSLFQLDKMVALGLSLEFILHEYAKTMELAFQTSLDWEKLSSVLDKLCIYCDALIQTSKQGTELLDVLDELRTTVVQQRNKCARGGMPTTETIQQFRNQLRTLFPLLSPCIKQASHSETALFALLEVRKTLNLHLGAGTVEQLLQPLFPKGPKQLRQTIADGFARRGFAHFPEQHHALFEGLTWKSSNQKL